MTFKDWLNNKKGIASVSELATRLGLSEFATSELLNGNIHPRIHDIIRIWIAFRLENAELMDLISIVADDYEISSSYIYEKLIAEVVSLTEQSKDGIIRLERNINL